MRRSVVGRYGAMTCRWCVLAPIGIHPVPKMPKSDRKTVSFPVEYPHPAGLSPKIYARRSRSAASDPAISVRQHLIFLLGRVRPHPKRRKCGFLRWAIVSPGSRRIGSSELFWTKLHFLRFFALRFAGFCDINCRRCTVFAAHRWADFFLAFGDN